MQDKPAQHGLKRPRTPTNTGQANWPSFNEPAYFQGPGSFITRLLGVGSTRATLDTDDVYHIQISPATYRAAPVIPKTSPEDQPPVGHVCVKPSVEEMNSVKPHPHAFFGKQGWHVFTPWPPTAQHPPSAHCPAVAATASSSEASAHHFIHTHLLVDPKGILRADASGRLGTVESICSDAVTSKPTPAEARWSLLRCSMTPDELAIVHTQGSQQCIPPVIPANIIHAFERSKMENPAMSTSPEATVALAWDSVWRSVLVLSIHAFLCVS